MSSPYRIGRRIQNSKLRKRVWLFVVLLLLGLLAGGGYAAVRIVKSSETEITLPEPIVHEYAAPEETDKAFDQAEFTIELPEDWVLKDHNETTMLNRYSYQATKKHEDNRWLEIYVDRVPTDRAFNRLLPVIVEDNRIVIASSASDNCINFTGDQDGGEPSSGPSELPAKWQGVDFLCDMGNYTRNVVGVGSPETGHNITLSGPETGEHTFYFVYIDHNINPDYQILERALESIEVK